MAYVLTALRKLPVNAASGIIQLHDKIYLVSDNESGFYIFDQTWNSRFCPLFPPILSSDPKLQKAQKPDLEVITAIGDFILCLPSGSTPQRMRAALWDQKNPAFIIDCSPLYGELTKAWPELNIEGAVVFDNTLRLFQRGNGARGQNALIDLDLSAVLLDFHKFQEIRPLSILNQRPVTIGDIRGAPLGFTDAALGPDGKIYFLAVAEASGSTYDDGAFNGAVLGSLDKFGRIASFDEILIDAKPEGLCFLGPNGDFLIVTDADNPQLLSTVHQGRIPIS